MTRLLAEAGWTASTNYAVDGVETQGVSVALHARRGRHNLTACWTDGHYSFGLRWVWTLCDGVCEHGPGAPPHPHIELATLAYRAMLSWIRSVNDAD